MKDEPLNWIKNQRAPLDEAKAAIDRLLPDGVSDEAHAFHAQIPGYETTPLKSLPQLARRLGVGGIWVKDESARMGLNAFKALGGSFAIYRFICKKLGLPALSFLELMSDDTRRRLGDLTFTSATDGNHGKGLAWAAQKLRFPCVIYVHKHTSQARIDSIAQYGAEVRVVDGTYDDAVRQCRLDAEANGWQIISDTSWPGYEEIPVWIMQGYSTLFAETQKQLMRQGVARPTHIFLQAGVGAFAAAALAYYEKHFAEEAPTSLIVEPRTAGCLYHSVEVGDGQPHAVDGDLQTVMAGLACGEPSPVAWNILRACADYIATVPDYVAARGMRMYGVPLKRDPFVVSGESGAVTLGALAFIMRYEGAAALKEQLGLDERSEVLLINTEGNTDPDYFRRIVWDGILPVPEEYSLQLAPG